MPSTAVNFVQHPGVKSRRCMAADEVRWMMARAYDDGDLPRARRLETFYESLMDTSPEEFVIDHD